MMRAPARAAIYAAEMRVVQARQKTRDSLCRARAALRAKIARPSTLAWAVGAAGLGGFWLARRRKRAASNVPASGVATAAKTSALGVVLAFIVRYGKPALPFILRQVQAAQRQRAVQAPAAVYPSTDVRH